METSTNDPYELTMEVAPWVDQDDFDEVAAKRITDGSLSVERQQQLESWRRDGFLQLSGAIPESLIDALRDDYERAWTERPPCSVRVAGHGVQEFPDVLPREELGHHYYRLLSFHEHSGPARDVMFHDSITSALGDIFDAPPVAMQSLFFEYGSEQDIHQDYPYVRAQHLPVLVGVWISLDDVDDDNGPLFYVPGSHRVPCFDWGDGRVWFDGEDESKVEDFADHLNAESERAGLDRLTLHTRKGDVLLWHAGLAHGGSQIIDNDRTRMSLVAHFSTQLAYPRDRRFADVDPIVEPVGSGFRYLKPEPAPPIPPPVAPDPSALPIPTPAVPTLARRIASRTKHSLRKIRR